MVFYNKVSSQFYSQAYNDIANYFGVSVALVTFAVAVLVIWTLVWKGLALWKCVKKNHFIWFIVLLVVNTLGILEILYIYLFSEFDKKKSLKKEKSSKKKK